MTPPNREQHVLPKVSRRRATVIHFIFQNVAILTTLAYGFFLTPLYVEKIPLALYGAWLATGNILGWIDLVDPGISSVLQQRVAFAYGSRDAVRLGEVIGTGVPLTFGISLLPMVAWPVGGMLGGLFHLSPADSAELATAFRVALAATSLSLAAYALNSVCLGLQLPLYTGAVLTASAVTGLVVTCVLLLLDRGLIAIPTGLAVRGALMLAGYSARVFVYARRHLPGKVRYSDLERKETLGNLGFTFVGRLGTNLAERVEALITGIFVSPAAVTVLTLTGRAYEPARMFSTRIAHALVPGLTHLAGEGNDDRTRDIVDRSGRVVTWVATVVVGGVALLNAHFVRIWVGESFFGGPWLSSVQALASSFSIFAIVIIQLAFGLGAVRETNVLALVEGVIRVALQVLLLKRFGLVGIPIGACIAAALVGSWLLPRVLDRYTRGEGRVADVWRRLLLRLVVSVVIFATLGALISNRIEGMGWASFVGAASIAGTLIAALGFALDARLRETVLQVVRRRQRGRAAAEGVTQ